MRGAPPVTNRPDTLCPYTTLFRSGGWLVRPVPGCEHALKRGRHGPLASRMLDIVGRLRRMFDLDADPRAIADALSSDPRLKPLLRERPGLRLPSGWDGFEIAVRAILGPQVSVVARSEEHTSELQSLMRISYGAFCSKHNMNCRLLTHTNQSSNR